MCHAVHQHCKHTRSQAWECLAACLCCSHGPLLESQALAPAAAAVGAGQASKHWARSAVPADVVAAAAGAAHHELPQAAYQCTVDAERGAQCGPVH